MTKANLLRFRGIAYIAERKRSNGTDFAGTLGLTLSSWLEARYF